MLSVIVCGWIEQQIDWTNSKEIVNIAQKFSFLGDWLKFWIKKLGHKIICLFSNEGPSCFKIINVTLAKTVWFIKPLLSTKKRREMSVFWSSLNINTDDGRLMRPLRSSNSSNYRTIAHCPAVVAMVISNAGSLNYSKLLKFIRTRTGRAIRCRVKLGFVAIKPLMAASVWV